MTGETRRAVLAACTAGAALAAHANDFDCSADIGRVVADATGAPALGSDGLPIFDGAPSGALRLDAYPAVLAMREVLTNVSTAGPSTVGTFSEWLRTASPLPASVEQLGAGFSAGFSLGVGESATRVLAFTVGSHDACTALAAAAAQGPVCGGVLEPGFSVVHLHGSAECRVRLVCAPDAQGVTP